MTAHHHYRILIYTANTPLENRPRHCRSSLEPSQGHQTSEGSHGDSTRGIHARGSIGRGGRRRVLSRVTAAARISASCTCTCTATVNVATGTGARRSTGSCSSSYRSSRGGRYGTGSRRSVVGCCAEVARADDLASLWKDTSISKVKFIQ